MLSQEFGPSSEEKEFFRMQRRVGLEISPRNLCTAILSLRLLQEREAVQQAQGRFQTTTVAREVLFFAKPLAVAVHLLDLLRLAHS